MQSIELFNFLYPAYQQRALNGLKLGPEDRMSYIFWTRLLEKVAQGKTKGVFFHVANEISSGKNIKFGMKLSLIGKVKGMADYIFMRDGQSLALEFKANKGRLSENQVFVKSWFEAQDIPYRIIVDDVDKAFEVLKEYGFITD